MHDAVFVFRGGNREVRYVGVDPLRFEVAIQKRCIVMVLIKIEYMICRRKHHFLSLGEDDGLQNVYKLCDVCHDDTVTVCIENVQRYSGDNGVAHGILLIQEARIRARFHIVPCTPLVYDQTDFVLGIVMAHDLRVACDKFFHV